MTDPIPRISRAIHRGRLDINSFISGIEVYIGDGGDGAGDGVRYADGLEVGGDEIIDILAGVGEEAEEVEGREGTHGAAVVVARDAAVGWLKGGGDVLVGAEGREAWSTAVVELENLNESLLVSDI